MRKAHVVLAGVSAGLLAGGLVIGGTGPAAEAKATKAPKPEVVELGRRLFMDPTVSRLGRNSCAACHDPEKAFSDARLKSPDDAGPTQRHSQTLVDLTGQGFHWDGQFQTVRQLLVARVAPADMANEQALTLSQSRIVAARKAGEAPAFVVAAESGTSDEPPPVPSGYGVVTPSEVPVTDVADRLTEDGRYAQGFSAAYGSPGITTDRILDAMDAYCASIHSTTNKFDRFMAGDDAALSATEQRGLALFEGNAGCAQCHVTKGEGGRAPFTDGKFHDTGVSYRMDLFCGPKLPGQKSETDTGRQAISFFRNDTAHFKTPTLRDVALRGPYMHDGSFATLTDVVNYYSQGGTPNTYLDPAVKKIGLDSEETADLVAFLESLTGERRAGLGFPPREAKPLKVRVEDLAGKPVPAFTVSVQPFGDRLEGAELVRADAAAITDDKGIATIRRPASTHVLLTNPSFELGLSRPIPDSAVSQTLIATPKDTVSLRVRRTEGGPNLPKTIRVFENGIGMAGCGPPPSAVLTRLRDLAPNEALYAGKVPAKPAAGRVSLVFDDGVAVRCDLDLSGGASETILLAAPRKQQAPRRSSAAGTGKAPPDRDGETDHATDDDRGLK